MEITINPKYSLGQKVWVVDRITKYHNCPTCMGIGEISLEYEGESKNFICPDCYGDGNLCLFRIPAFLEINRISFNKSMKYEYTLTGYLSGGTVCDNEIYLTKEEALNKAIEDNRLNLCISIPKSVNIKEYIRY